MTSEHQDDGGYAQPADHGGAPEMSSDHATIVASKVAVGKEKYHHGRSPAGWTGSLIALVGFLTAAVGFFLNINWVVVAAGLAVAVLGAVVGGILARAGFGQVWE